MISFENLILAWKKARKGKTKKPYVIIFEQELFYNLMALHYELKYFFYHPKPLEAFVIRDPKTRKIHKSDFRDRIIHHAIVNILEPIFDKIFIHDSYANRIGKGALRAVQRFESFRRKETHNFTKEAFCLKADIYHYFQEVDLDILLRIIQMKIKDIRVLWIIKQILTNNANFEMKRERELSKKGMPLGNLTSQFFANIYLNELDYFIKHKLKANHYIRYVDDFVLISKSEEQLIKWKEQINEFLEIELKLKLHPQKSKIISLSKGIDFLGFRNFFHFRILRKRSIKKMHQKIANCENGNISYRELTASFQGWQAHALLANTFKLRKRVAQEIAKVRQKKTQEIKEQYKGRIFTHYL